MVYFVLPNIGVISHVAFVGLHRLLCFFLPTLHDPPELPVAGIAMDGGCRGNQLFCVFASMQAGAASAVEVLSTAQREAQRQQAAAAAAALRTEVGCTRHACYGWG